MNKYYIEDIFIEQINIMKNRMYPECKYKNIVFDIDESANKQTIKLNDSVKGKYVLFVEEYETTGGDEVTNYAVAVNHKDGSKENFEGEVNRGQGKVKIGEFEIK